MICLWYGWIITGHKPTGMKGEIMKKYILRRYTQGAKKVEFVTDDQDLCRRCGDLIDHSGMAWFCRSCMRDYSSDVQVEVRHEHD